MIPTFKGRIIYVLGGRNFKKTLLERAVILSLSKTRHIDFCTFDEQYIYIYIQ